MIFQKMRRSIQSRRISRQNVDKVIKQRSDTSVETETVTAGASENSSSSVDVHGVGFIEECSSFHQKNTQQQHHHQPVLNEERKGYMIQSIQEVIRHLHHERSVCQLELNNIMIERKQTCISYEMNNKIQSCCFFLDDETTLHHDIHNEKLFYYYTIRLELIQQTIVEVTDLQYSIENDYVQEEQQIKRIETFFGNKKYKNGCFSISKIDQQ